MTATEPLPGPTLISVIVPARNEEDSLAACLQSLAAQTGANFEIIVVDDHSTDRTREIALSFSGRGVLVIEAPPLPPGWTGKNNALAAGAQKARGEWLLFTDADTVHLPGSLSRALDEAESLRVAMLSYSPRQVVNSFWEKAVMPVIFAELAATYRPRNVSNPESPAAAANGQYILISRQAYDAIGGHARIANEILEDVALARAVKHSGLKLSFRYAAGSVRTRMYRTFEQLREGWTKNLALLFPAAPGLAALRTLEFLLIVASVALAVVNARQGRLWPAMIPVVSAIALYAAFIARIRRAHFDWYENLLSFLGLPLFSWLLLRSWLAHRRGSVSWKGRSYPTREAVAYADAGSSVTQTGTAMKQGRPKSRFVQM